MKVHKLMDIDRMKAGYLPDDGDIWFSADHSEAIMYVGNGTGRASDCGNCALSGHCVMPGGASMKGKWAEMACEKGLQLSVLCGRGYYASIPVMEAELLLVERRCGCIG